MRGWGVQLRGGLNAPPRQQPQHSLPPSPLPGPASPQRRNFEFFITVAMGVDNRLEQPAGVDFVVVQSGDTCTPCARLAPLLR